MRRRSYVLVALLLALLAGCGFKDIVDLQDELQDAGYDVQRVFVSTSNGLDVVEVTWDSKATTQQGVRDEGTGIARIVWERARFRVDGVSLVATGIDVPGMGRYEQGRIDRAGLERDFGPRRPGLDDQSVFRKLIVFAVVAVLLGIASIVLIVVLVKRTKRRNQGPPGAWGPPPPPGAWGRPPAAPPPPAPPSAPYDPWAAPPA